MDFSSSSSSSPSQYKGSANRSSRPRWDLPIYDTPPHFPPPPPPMDSRLIITLNSQEISSSSLQDTGRLASSSSSPASYSNYPHNYPNYNYGAGDGGAGASRTVETQERRTEGGDRPGGESWPSTERDHMFDKVVTPSDVGKLNRLVIPKQHAEKYFPLDSSSSDKGLLLDFEDRNGKSWRFRYSYWNSSQSYVMTKGWSRFVKEKKLDAGDVVSFHRGVGEIAKDRFYIDWRRRPDALPPPHHHHHNIQFQHGFSLHHHHHHRSIQQQQHHHPPQFLLAGPRPPPPLPQPPLVYHQQQQQGRDHIQLMRGSSVISYNGLGTAATLSGYNGDNINIINNNNYGVLSPNFCHQGSAVYMRGPQHQQHQMQMQMELAAGRNQTTTDQPMVFDSVPVSQGGTKSAAAKRLRLFGVNMDCTVTTDDDDGRDESQALSSSSSHLPVSTNVNPTVMVMSHSSSSAVGASGSLQLRLHGSPVTNRTTTDFLDKGKSSMSLDFDL